MKAARLDGYGRLVLREVPVPEPAAGEVLVRVRAASVNPVDWYAFAGRPYVARPLMGLRSPRDAGAGSDVAGVVEAVGAGVDHVSPGDAVYGHASGAFADYALAKDAIAPMPANASFEEAAAVPVAAFTALQGLRDHAGVAPGDRVLVNGAAGGVGTFAVQIAGALGARVHAVCSARNLDQARQLGAARAYDYEREDFSRSGERYDVLYDVAGSRSWRAMRRVLAPRARVVLVGGPRGRRLLGPLGHVARVKLAAALERRPATFAIAKPNRADLDALRALIEDGRVRPVVERRYRLADVDEALRTMSTGHARGKIVVTV